MHRPVYIEECIALTEATLKSKTFLDVLNMKIRNRSKAD